MSFLWRSVMTEYKFQFRRNLARPTYVFMLFVNPLVMTMLLFFIVDSRDPSLLMRTVVTGSGLIGIWSAVLFSSAADIVREKESGTFAYLAASTTNLMLIMLGKVLTSASITFLTLVQAYLYTSLFAGILLPVPHPGWSLLTLGVMIYALIGLSMAIATLFALSELARTFQNILELPMLLISGLVIPVSALPWFVQPISWAVPMTWAAEALRGSLLEAPNLSSLTSQLAITMGLGTLYYLLSVYLFRVIEHRMRIDGTLGEL